MNEFFELVKEVKEIVQILLKNVEAAEETSLLDVIQETLSLCRELKSLSKLELALLPVPAGKRTALRVFHDLALSEDGDGYSQHVELNCDFGQHWLLNCGGLTAVSEVLGQVSKGSDCQPISLRFKFCQLHDGDLELAFAQLQPGCLAALDISGNRITAKFLTALFRKHDLHELDCGGEVLFSSSQTDELSLLQTIEEFGRSLKRLVVRFRHPAHHEKLNRILLRNHTSFERRQANARKLLKNPLLKPVPKTTAAVAAAVAVTTTNATATATSTPSTTTTATATATTATVTSTVNNNPPPAPELPEIPVYKQRYRPISEDRKKIIQQKMAKEQEILNKMKSKEKPTTTTVSDSADLVATPAVNPFKSWSVSTASHSYDIQTSEDWLSASVYSEIGINATLHRHGTNNPWFSDALEFLCFTVTHYTAFVVDGVWANPRCNIDLRQTLEQDLQLVTDLVCAPSQDTVSLWNRRRQVLQRFEELLATFQETQTALQTVVDRCKKLYERNQSASRGLKWTEAHVSALHWRINQIQSTDSEDDANTDTDDDDDDDEYWFDFPVLVVETIAEFVDDTSDLMKMSLVNSRWRQAILENGEELWHQRVLADFGSPVYWPGLGSLKKMRERLRQHMFALYRIGELERLYSMGTGVTSSNSRGDSSIKLKTCSGSYYCPICAKTFRRSALLVHHYADDGGSCLERLTSQPPVTLRSTTTSRTASLFPPPARWHACYRSLYRLQATGKPKGLAACTICHRLVFSPDFASRFYCGTSLDCSCIREQQAAPGRFRFCARLLHAKIETVHDLISLICRQKHLK